MELSKPNWLTVIVSFLIALIGYMQIANMPVIGAMVARFNPGSGAELMFIAWLILFAGVIAKKL